MPSSATTYYAKWTVYKVYVQIHMNDGTSSPKTSATVCPGNSIDLTPTALSGDSSKNTIKCGSETCNSYGRLVFTKTSISYLINSNVTKSFSSAYSTNSSSSTNWEQNIN